MTRYSYHFVVMLVIAVAALALSEAALAQEAGTDAEQGLEGVLRATEGLPADIRDEIEGAYRGAASSRFFSFYDPACIALAYWEWRRENPDGPGRLRQFQSQDEEGRISACADRDRIVSNVTENVRQRLSKGRARGLSEDQSDWIATCSAELVADWYLENPVPRPADSSFQRRLTILAEEECLRQHRGR